MPTPEEVQEELRALALDAAKSARDQINKQSLIARGYVEIAYLAASAAGLPVGPPLERHGK